MVAPLNAPKSTTERSEKQLVSLLISIVNYRTADLVINCLRSLQAEVNPYPNVQVIVVDNNSGDGSAEKIATAIRQEGWQDWASVIASPVNGGFSYGNNLAIRTTLELDVPPDYYMLLNPDTEVRSGAIQALVQFMTDHPNAGIAGSCIEKENGDLKPLAFRFPSVFSELDSGLRLGLVSKLLNRWKVALEMPLDHPRPVDWLPGACMIIRRDVFQSIGLMDEHYFLYYEETDFCLQAKRAGWTCWFVPESRVMHLAGQSTGVTGDQEKRKRLPQYVFDSRHRFFVKNYGVAYAMLADLAWVSGLALWRLRSILQRKPYEGCPYLLQDALRNSIFLKGVRIS